MFTLWEPAAGSGPRVTRRAVLRAGSLGVGWLTLADRLRLQSTASEPTRPAADTSVIHVFLGGGPSHIDTFDLKPQAPAEVRGEFLPVATNVPGIHICEHLPRLARQMHRLAIVRSVAHGTASHLPASHWMVTGHRASSSATSNEHPYVGALVSKLRGPNVPGMPAYASIPRRQLLGSAAYLGAAYNPFTTESDPNADDYAVINLHRPAGLAAARVEDRAALRQSLDRLRADVDRRGEMAGVDRFARQAWEMVSGTRAQEAFDIAQEDPRTRDWYGRTPAGQRCLLARRLVEAGVTFVTVLPGGEWDTHRDNFRALRERSLPLLDQALSALIADLSGRGLDQRVLVLVSGEFGRTPTINPFAGRDHWPGAISVLFAGGGLPMGQSIGATDRLAARPVTHPYSPGDVLATIYRFLGVDTSAELVDRSGRPRRVLDEGTPIAEFYA